MANGSAGDTVKMLAAKFRATGFIDPALMNALNAINPDVVAGILLHSPRYVLYAHAVRHYRKIVAGGQPRAFAANVAVDKFSFGDQAIGDQIRRECENPSRNTSAAIRHMCRTPILNSALDCDVGASTTGASNGSCTKSKLRRRNSR